MFLGVDNVKNYALGKDSIKCYVNCGIYPYFRELFKAKVNNSPFFVTFLKESLNKKNWQLWVRFICLLLGCK